jgi:hypothetical protein
VLLLAGIFMLALSPARTGVAKELLVSSSSLLSEMRLGMLRHDAGVFVSRKEEHSIDINFELLLHSPDFMKYVLSPRPHIGVTGNTNGNTSQAYLGLTWDFDLFDELFLEMSLGGSIHNSKTDSRDPNKKNLGCRGLYRGSASLGYRFTERQSLSVMVDHASHNEYCKKDDGIDSFGLRWGYRF